MELRSKRARAMSCVSPEVLDEAIERAEKLVNERSSDLDDQQRKEIAKSIGIGALKYADLSNNRVKNYVFDWDRMLSMEGNTAPYLQYAVARINSIITKAVQQEIAFDGSAVLITSEHERTLVKNLSAFSETLDDVVESLEPHRLSTYLFDLAQSFSGFYENCPVLKEEKADVRASRLVLCTLVARTLRTGLDLLGIDSPERL
jgi:arginyl-tRNA synthetase